MSVIVYAYSANPSEILALKKRYKAISVCQEMVPPPHGVRVHLNTLVEHTLKKPSVVVVTKFSELGDNLVLANKNAHTILQKGHLLRVESKNVEFKTPKEFEEYIGEFLAMLPETEVSDGRRGPKSKITPRMQELINQAAKQGMSLRDIEEFLKNSGEFESVPSYKTIGNYLPDSSEE